MRFFIAISLLSFLGGCTANFTGEWVEKGVTGPNGTQMSPSGERRMALSFDPISGVRYGRIDEAAQVVDNVSVRSGEYFVYDGWNKAEFGSMVATVNGDQMVAGVTGGEKHEFNRVHGPSIFPPLVEVPSLTEK